MKRWMKALLALAVLAGLTAPATLTQAQDAPAPADDEENVDLAENDTRIEVPFEFEGLIFVEAKVNGQGPYKFMFDSGATQTVLNDRLADDLDLEQHDMPGGGGVQGVGEAEAKLVILDDIEMGDYSRGKCVAATLNLDHISGSLGYHLMGIIGQNVIRMIKETEIHFADSMLRFTEYGEDEMPRDPDSMLISMLEGGGGFPGLPEGLPDFPDPEDIPGFPGPDDGDGEDEFSINPPGTHFTHSPGMNRPGLLQDDGEAGLAEVPVTPTEPMTLHYKTVSVPLMGELIPLWYVDCKLNGTSQTFMFDTGASMMLALGDDLESDLNLTTSFGYPVKGIGTGEAHSTMIDSFEIGDFRVEEIPATVMDLPKVTEQLPEFLRLFVPLLERQGIILDFDGILGITLATRYKIMTVDTQAKSIEFTPYEEGETNHLAPYADEEFVKDAVIRTWHGKAGKFGLKGDAVPFDEWEDQGLESGGLRVEQVEEDGAAAQAGIREGDIITHLVGMADEFEEEDLEDAGVEGNDISVRDLPGLIILACGTDPGSEITVRVRRDDGEHELTIKLDRYGWEGTIPERYRQD